MAEALWDEYEAGVNAMCDAPTKPRPWNEAAEQIAASLRGKARSLLTALKGFSAPASGGEK